MKYGNQEGNDGSLVVEWHMVLLKIERRIFTKIILIMSHLCLFYLQLGHILHERIQI